MQRMAMAPRVNIAFPSRPLSPAFSVEQCSSDAVTRGVKISSTLDNSAASGLPGMLSGSASGPSVLPVPKSAGIVEGSETSFREETGLRHSLDDPDHDVMSDFEKIRNTCVSRWSLLSWTHLPLRYTSVLHFLLSPGPSRGCTFFDKGRQGFQTIIVDRYSLLDFSRFFASA